MKKVELFLVKSLTVAFVCFSVIACDEASEKVSFYDMSPISRFENKTARTIMYHNGRNVNEFNLYEQDALISTTNVSYRADGIFCTLNGIQYHIQPDNVLGATRARLITATKGGGLFYETEYFYINERLAYAKVNAPEEPESPFQINFSYNESQVKIQELGIEYTIELCDEENTGYACNILGYAETPLTPQYVINPNLYFLNIYGRPVEKLPSGCEIVRSEKTMRVGKYFYEYRD
jgi:hypothetical protein